MRLHQKRSAIAVLLATAMALPASGLLAQQAASTPGHQAALEMVKDWNPTARQAAVQTIEEYGAPAALTETQLVWFENGPWKRTVVYNHAINHDFPIPHHDALEQVVSYDVPPDKFDELAHFDGSVSVDRTRGELIASCDSEPANYIALNLAHDIITGKRTVEEARLHYPQVLVDFLQGKPAPYAEKLAFSPPPKAGFSDEPVLSRQMIEEVKDLKQAMMRKRGAAGATGKPAARGERR